MDFFDDDDDNNNNNEEKNNSNNKDNNKEINRELLLQQRPKSCGIITFHNGIEEAMLLHVERTIENNNYNSNNDNDKVIHVLNAIDSFCYSRHWMMHIGDQKGLILDQTIQSLQSNINGPIYCVEIGSYCGYSAVRIASQFIHNESKLFCIERESKCIEWTRRLLTVAGLIDHVILIHGDCQVGIEYLKENNISPIHFLFIDHDKSLYLPDLIQFEASKLLKCPNGIVFADNVLSLGTPLQSYLDHVRGIVNNNNNDTNDNNNDNNSNNNNNKRLVNYQSSVLHKSSLEYSVSDDKLVNDGDYLEDGIEISVLGEYLE